MPLDPSSVPSSIAVHRSRRELERSLARDLTRMRAFYRISLLASSEAVPEEIGARILNEFTRTLEFRRAEIWLLGKDRRLRRLSSHGRVPARVASARTPPTLAAESPKTAARLSRLARVMTFSR